MQREKGARMRDILRKKARQAEGGSELDRREFMALASFFGLSTAGLAGALGSATRASRCAF